MSLIQFERVQVGEVGVLPGTVKMVSTDNLATITSAGYINQRVSDVQLSPSDVIECLYSYNQSTGSGTYAEFQPSISGGVITLVINVSPGNVLLPVTSGNFAVFNGITGQIKDGGYLPSNAAKTRVVMLNAAPTVGHLAAFTDVNGTIGDGGVAATVTVPTVANDIAVFTNVSGNIGEATAPVSLPQPLTVSGNILAGKSGTAGYLASFPAGALSGNLRLIGVANAGNFNVDISNASFAQSSVISIPDVGAATGNFIVSSIAGAGTQLITIGSLQISAGNLSVGSIAGGAGSIISYPTTAANGSLILAAIDAGGAFNTTISNSVMGQSSVISIPDPGAATGKFILSSTLAGSQTLSGSLSFVGGGSNIQTTGGGNFIAGASGAAGFFVSYPPAAASGRLIVEAINSGNFDVTINNASMAQATVYTIPDAGNALGDFLVAAGAAPFTSGNFPVASGTGGLMVDSGRAANVLLYSGIANPDQSIDLVRFDVTVGQADLAAGASKVLYASAGSKQYKVVALWINSGGTNFSGGGGDRLGEITDGTTVYSIIPAATMQALVNAGWGIGTDLPYPASAPLNTSTVAGASLVMKYNTGTTDYTSGSVVISGILERVA